MSIPITDNVFAFSASDHTEHGALGTPEISIPGAGAQNMSRTNLPDVVSGGNPLVASANVLLNLVPQIRAMASNADPEGFQRLLLANIREFERSAGVAGVPIETVIGARYCLCTVVDEAAAQTPCGGSGVWPKFSLLVALHN